MIKEKSNYKYKKNYSIKKQRRDILKNCDPEDIPTYLSLFKNIDELWENIIDDLKEKIERENRSNKNEKRK